MWFLRFVRQSSWEGKIRAKLSIFADSTKRDGRQLEFPTDDN